MGAVYQRLVVFFSPPTTPLSAGEGILFRVRLS
jgi:hypothetical protein